MQYELGWVVLTGALAMGLAPVTGAAAESQGVQSVTLQIDGMTCGACVKGVKAALAKVPGVSAVELTVGKKWFFFSDYSDARALVRFDPEKANVEQLIRAIEAAGSPLSAYKARLVDK